MLLQVSTNTVTGPLASLTFTVSMRSIEERILVSFSHCLLFRTSKTVLHVSLANYLNPVALWMLFPRSWTAMRASTYRSERDQCTHFGSSYVH